MDPLGTRVVDDDDAARAAVRGRLREAVVDVAPVFGFTVSYALIHRLTVALVLAFAAGAGVCAYRVVRRDSVWRALAALGVVCVQGALAAKTGEATNFFLPSLVVHSAMAVVNAVLTALGWPLLGVVMGLITKDRAAWRRCTVRRRAFVKGNLVILTGSLLTLSIQLPLFLTGQAVALGAVEAFGPLVLALGALLGWRVYRRALGDHHCGSNDRMNTETSLPLERTHP